MTFEMNELLPTVFKHRSMMLVRVHGPAALSRIAKVLYVLAAALLGLVGLIGLVLPILPGVLLLMISATLLSKVWPAFGVWFERQPLVGSVRSAFLDWRSRRLWGSNPFYGGLKDRLKGGLPEKIGRRFKALVGGIPGQLMTGFRHLANVFAQFKS